MNRRTWKRTSSLPGRGFPGATRATDSPDERRQTLKGLLPGTFHSAVSRPCGWPNTSKPGPTVQHDRRCDHIQCPVLKGQGGLWRRPGWVERFGHARALHMCIAKTASGARCECRRLEAYASRPCRAAPLNYMDGSRGALETSGSGETGWEAPDAEIRSAAAFRSAWAVAPEVESRPGLPALTERAIKGCPVKR